MNSLRNRTNTKTQRFKEKFFSVKYHQTLDNQPLTLEKGTYLIECFGAQGGSNEQYSGGMGSHISGVVYNDQDSNTFTITVGKKGSDALNKNQANPGGLPDGGSSGFSTRRVDSLGSAGGGGSSSVYMNNELILVAAGGSGAAGNCHGAPGGNLQNAYKYNFLGSNSYKLTTETQPSNSQCDTSASDARASLPPSGIGGGHPCGNKGGAGSDLGQSSFRVASSGWSYYNNNRIRLIQMDDGTSDFGRSGDGDITINNYCTDSNCINCYNDQNKCTYCKEGYRANSNGKCELSCSKYIQDGQCQERCNLGYFADNNNICQKCPDHCDFCTSSTSCSSCSSNYVLQGDSCQTKCNPHWFKNVYNRCEECSSNCLECEGTTTTCTSCGGNLSLQGSVCKENCDSHYFKNENKCLICDKNCLECNGQGENSCTKCNNDKFLENQNCKTSCSESKYGNITTNTCDSCPERCKTCNSLSNCTKCVKGYHLSSGNCNYLASHPYDIYQISNFNKKVFKYRHE